MKDDGVVPTGTVRLPDVPFRIFVPDSVDYRQVNLEVWHRLEMGEPFEIEFAASEVRRPRSGGGWIPLAAGALVLAFLNWD